MIYPAVETNPQKVYLLQECTITF